MAVRITTVPIFKKWNLYHSHTVLQITPFKGLFKKRVLSFLLFCAETMGYAPIPLPPLKKAYCRGHRDMHIWGGTMGWYGIYTIYTIGLSMRGAGRALNFVRQKPSIIIIMLGYVLPLDFK